MLPLRARVDLGVMAIKSYSAFPKTPALLESHHQIVWCHLQHTLWGSLTPQQKCSECILQPQPTRPSIEHTTSCKERMKRTMLPSLYDHWFLVVLYGISTIVGYLMPNPFYTYILNIYNSLAVIFYGISTIVGYLMPNPFIYILNIWFLNIFLDNIF